MFHIFLAGFKPSTNISPTHKMITPLFGHSNKSKADTVNLSNTIHNPHWLTRTTIKLINKAEKKALCEWTKKEYYQILY